jgi:hypothetical protein
MFFPLAFSRENPKYMRATCFSRLIPHALIILVITFGEGYKLLPVSKNGISVPCITQDQLV